MCQDTGTAIVMGKRGQNVWTTGQDEEHISRGVFDAYRNLNLRYSQLSPLSMWKERNTGSNLPAQIEIYADTHAGHENTYEFLFVAKGGGSANKSFLFQETTALLKPETFAAFLDEKLRLIGTAACPPYHLAIVVGGTSAEHTLKTAKLASAHYLDDLPIHGTDAGHGYRDLAMEADVLHMTQQFGIGAQFGGKYFCHDVRVIRLPRHGASCPVGIAVSCSADRQALAKITPEGAFLEQLEPDPARFLPDITDDHLDNDVVRLDLTEPMDRIRATLSTLPVKTRCHSPVPSSSPATSRTLESRRCWIAVSRYPTTSRTTRCITPAQRKRPRGMRRALSARRRPAGWTRTSTNSKRLAVPSSCWRKETAALR